VADYKKHTDQELILMFQDNKDERAYNELVYRYKDKLLNFVIGFMKDYEVSQNLVQDTFVKLYTHGHTYKEISKFSTWIFTIAGNLAKTELRKLKRRQTYAFSQLSNDDNEFVLDRFEFKDDHGQDDERRELYNETLGNIYKLDEESRVITIMRNMQELSYDEISKILKLPIGTVKSRINRARLKIVEMSNKRK